MNILFANTQEFNPQIGGVERVSTTLAQKLQQKGHKVCFLACNLSSYSKEYKPVATQTILPNSKDVESTENVQTFLETLKNNSVDIIVNQAGNVKDFSSLCFNATKKYNHAKMISVIHIDPGYKFKSLLDLSSSILPSMKGYRNWLKLIVLPYRMLKTYQFDKELYRFIYNNSDSVVLLSDHFKKDFKKITRLSSYRKLSAISNPFPYEGENLDISDKKGNKIVYVGRLDYGHKRADRLLDIWSRIAPDFPSWSLDIVGDGRIGQELVDFVKSNKIERVNFVGFADPIEYYKKAQILCMTSTFEGFGMVLIEAAYYGCIPIAFNSFASLRDIIDDEKNGCVVTPYKLGEYENKLRRLMNDNKLREKIQKQSAKIPTKFRAENITGQWVRLFDALMKDGSI